MSLDTSLSIATGSIANINARLGVLSNNVANASTPDYSVVNANQSSLDVASQLMGVHSDAATRSINMALQQSMFQQDTAVSGLMTTTASLQSIDSLQGTPGQGNDLGSLLNDVQSAFSTLLGNPGSGAQQSVVVSTATTLANNINMLSNAYTQQRQAAQNGIVAGVSSMNRDLSQIGALNSQIVGARLGGQSSAALENQRDAVVHSLSEMVGIKTLNQPNGNLIINTASGTQLPTDATTGPLLTLNSTIGAGSSYAGGTIPPITMGGIDITSQLQGGSIGANIALRDVTMPTFSAELDEFSSTLANQFSAQGLTLFADPNGNVPVGGGIPVQSGYVGFASEIQVNPAVIATPSLVRDGTQDTAGSPVGASVFVTNPPGGPAGFTALINRVLNFTFGVNAQPGVPQPASNTFGLGVDGNLAAPYASPSTLAEGATALVSAQAAVSAAATSQLGTEQTVQTALNNNMSAVSGVNMDTEMSHMIQLQNAYGANARVISAVQAMFSQLLQSIQ